MAFEDEVASASGAASDHDWIHYVRVDVYCRGVKTLSLDLRERTAAAEEFGTKGLEETSKRISV